MGAVRSTPPCESHDLAEDTRRPAFSTPRFWASRPAMVSGCGSQGRAVEPAGKSVAPGMYRNEGKRLSSGTPGGGTRPGGGRRGRVGGGGGKGAAQEMKGRGGTRFGPGPSEGFPGGGPPSGS